MASKNLHPNALLAMLLAAITSGCASQSGAAPHDAIQGAINAIGAGLRGTPVVPAATSP